MAGLSSGRENSPPKKEESEVTKVYEVMKK